jgi:hypothetical protein
MSSFHSFNLAAVSLLLAAAAACSSETGPAVEPLEDRVVAVGEELLIEVHGTSLGGRKLSYAFTSNHPRLGDRATLAARPDGAGVFRWVPTALDIGTWVFDFSVSRRRRNHRVDDHRVPWPSAPTPSRCSTTSAPAPPRHDADRVHRCRRRGKRSDSRR